MCGYLGARTVDSDWRWAEGPESGQEVGITGAHWGDGQPASSIDSYMAMNAPGAAAGTWHSCTDDLTNCCAMGYFLEYEGDTQPVYQSNFVSGADSWLSDMGSIEVC